MNSPDDSLGSPRLLARFTPDSRRWRRRVAGLATIGAVLSLYAMFAVVSGVKSGPVYNLLALLFAVLSLLLPAVAVTTMFAPTSDPTRRDASRSESPVETLKRRYAAGEIGQDEFDRRLDDLIEASEDTRDRPDAESVERRRSRDAELDSVR